MNETIKTGLTILASGLVTVFSGMILLMLVIWLVGTIVNLFTPKEMEDN